MRKLFTLAALLLTMVATASAKQKVCDLSALPSSSENTTWDAATNTFAWSATSYNSTEAFGAGDYSAYTTLNYTAEAGTADHFRIIVKYSNGTDQTTYSAAMGTVSLTWAQLGVSADNLPYISTIRISGDNNAIGNIKLTSFYLEGPDVVTYDPITLYPQNATELSKLTGTNTKWASTVVYPKTLAVQGSAFGDGDGGSESTHVTVSDYESLTFVVSQGGTAGITNVQPATLRVWMWDGSKVVTLYPHLASEYDDVTDWTAATEIAAPGTYKVKIAGYDYLKGVKAANAWGSQAIIVDYAYATPKNANEYAVDEARTYSSAKILDFTGVTDVEAYIETEEGGKIAMKQVTGAVPANTGIILKQKSNNTTLSIPTCGTATEDVTGNLLVGTTKETTLDGSLLGVTNYVLAGTGSSLGWYSIGATSATLAANKCYLSIPEATSPAKSFISLWDEIVPTAVKSVEAAESNDGAFYTVSGVKVAKPTKGLYIHNGKKYIAQ